MNKIFDTFLYYDEVDILKIRLKYLEKYIDNFIILECDHDFNGNYKGFNFKIDNFINFKNQIIYYKFFLKKRNNNNNWYIHDLSRDILYNKLCCYVNNNDYVLHGDIDEIPNRRYLYFFKKLKANSTKIFCFNQKNYFFKFNFYDPEIWSKCKISQFKNIKSFSNFRKLKSKSYKFYRLDIFFHPNKTFKMRILKYGGWHLTWMRSLTDIFKKILSVIEFKNKINFDISTFEQLIKKKINVVNLIHGKKTFLEHKVFSNEFPKSLKKILNNYTYFIE